LSRSDLLTWLLGSAAATVIYWVTCIAVFSSAIALGDSDLQIGPVVEDIIGIILKVLAFPVDLMPSFPEHLIALLGFNSLIWGPAMYAFVQLIGRRRNVAA
jgi:hypothetical protein